MAKFIYDSFSTFDEAEIAVEALIKSGVYQGDITIVINSQYVKEDVSRSGAMIHKADILDEDSSWWDAVVSFFSPELQVDEEHSEEFGNYKELVLKGAILVLVEDFYLPNDASDEEN